MLKRLSMLAAAGAFVTMLVPAANALTPAPLPGVSDVIHVAERLRPRLGPQPLRPLRARRLRRRRTVVVGAPVVVARPVVVCRSVRTAYGWRKVCR